MSTGNKIGLWVLVTMWMQLCAFTAQAAVPVITEGASSTVIMDEDSSPIAFNRTLNATDADLDTLSWSISIAALRGTATASGTGASKVIGYTPDANYNGSDFFTVQVFDGLDTATHLVNVTINPQNDTPTGTVTITGVATEDQVLNASNNLFDEEGIGVITYQWQRDGTDITDAIGDSYTLGDDDVGTLITVLASYIDEEGTFESVSSSSVGPIVNVNDLPGGAVNIDNTTPSEGDVLTASNSLTDADGMGTVSYQWQRDGSDISDATSASYTTVQADVGFAIRVVASYTDLGGTTESVPSANTALVSNENNPPTGSVNISGTATEDQTLSASNSLADLDGMGTVSYQWQRNSVDIVGATSDSYTLGDDDAGATITVIASYVDGGGTSESVSSSGVGPVVNVNDPPGGTVVINNTTPSEGDVLSAGNSLTDADGMGIVSYQWQRDGSDISGETTASYTTVQADVGLAIRVVASYTDLQGTLESVPSLATALVINVNSAPTGSVNISGIATEDQILSASNSLADADGMGEVSYQWQRNSVDIAGATSDSYTLGDNDAGATITVIASYIDGGGTSESVSSIGVGPIVNVNDLPGGELGIDNSAPAEDDVLTAINNLTDADGMGTVSYQWQRNSVDIGGATSISYTLGDSDVGATITVIGSYTDGGGTNESVSSSGVGPVVNVNDLPGGTVTIDNTTPSEGDILTVSNTLTDADGMGTVSYQWQRDGSDISGETTASYTTVQADVGLAIRVVASYTDLQGTLESVPSLATALVINVNSTPTGSVNISGITNEDQQLSASNNLADADGMGEVNYQWQRNSVDIVGATSGIYTLGDDDVGTTITVIGSYTDGGGTNESVSSSGVGPVINVNDFPSGTVTIDNTTPSEGDLLSASNTLTDADGMGTVSYQWQRDGSDISGETTASYTTVQADVGLAIRVVASYTDLQGTLESVPSLATDLVINVNNAPVGNVNISGIAAEDQQLSASNNLADADGMGEVNYQWQRNSVDIVGATSASYTLGDNDVGTTVTVIASYIDGGGTSESVSSVGLGPIVNVNDPPGGTVGIDNSAPAEGDVLTASNSLTDADGMGTVSYQWQRNSVNIVSATGASYTLGDDDVGTLIRVVASYTDGGGANESVSSIGVGPIVNVNDSPGGVVNIDNTTPAQGDVLNASNSLTDADGMGTVSYQWQRAGANISGATGPAYTTVQADVGSTIRVVASYIDLQGTAESVVSVSTSLVSNVNDPPVITNTANASAPINILYSFVPNVEDPDAGDTTSFTHNASLPAWLDFDPETGALSGTPTIADVDSIVSGNITVTDAASASGQVNFAITVTGSNSPPVISGTPLTTIGEDAEYSFSVTSTDPDIEDTASYFLQNNPSWMGINDATGQVSGVPLNTDVGTTEDIIVGVRDSAGVEDSLTFSLIVTNTNDPPEITSTAGLVASEDALYSYTLIASDIDVGDSLTYSAAVLPDWLSFDASSRLLSGTPDDPDLGSHGVTLRVSDGSVSVEQSFIVSVTGHNDSPTISGTPGTAISEGHLYTFTPTASDPDISNNLSFSITNQPGWASFDISTGTLSGTPSTADIGSTSGIIIGVSDGIVTVNLPAFDLAVVDNNPPVVTPPTDITVNASGLFTRVDFGVATAVDSLNGSLLVSHDQDVNLPPGHHIVTWSATDSAGNTGYATQNVNVIPLVEFAPSQVSAEGSSGSVNLILNGSAVNYPVTVPFTVSGTATSGSDHNLTNGEVIISNGTEASISFNVLDDDIVEGAEVIIISIGTVTNAVVGAQASHTIELVEGNVAPQVTLSAIQVGGSTHMVSQLDGLVNVSAVISDVNSNDTHSYDWSTTDNALVDNDGITSNGVFRFNPLDVNPGVYTLRVVVSDGSLSGDAELILEVVTVAPQLSLTGDSDNDGIADATEGYGDEDNDGIADYLDAIDARNVLQGLAANQFLMETETGLVLSLGRVAFQAKVNKAGVSTADVTTYANDGSATADELTNLGGLFDFMISGIPIAGDSVRVVLPQLRKIPANAIYRKLLSTGWVDFKVDSKNSISSAPGLQGYCPPPGDIAYSPGLIAGYWCVQLDIEDGGSNDADGLANHRIADPGGVARLFIDEPLDDSVTVKVDSGGGVWHPLMLLLGIFLRSLRLTDKDKKNEKCSYYRFYYFIIN